MLFGPVNGGEYGEHSDLLNLDNSGDPVFSTDYRSIYASILDNWFQLPPDQTSNVLNGSFEKLNFVDSSVASSNEGSGAVPKKFTLNQNYPNPFNPTTTISFTLPEASDIKLTVYDINGREVSAVADERLQAGDHRITFDASSLPSGVYLYKLVTPSHSQTRKMTLIK
jgi:hypothetical protein